MANFRFGKWFAFTARFVITIIAAGTVVLHAGPISAQSSLEARVQKLEDREAIRNLLVEYGHDLDTQNLAGYANLFAKDGTWSGGIGSAKGPAGILAMVRKLLGKAPPYDPNHVRSFYVMTNFYIQVDGNRATAISKWMLLARSKDNKLIPRLSGHYNDVFIREAGKWKFLSRVAPRDIPNPGPDTFRHLL